MLNGPELKFSKRSLNNCSITLYLRNCDNFQVAVKKLSEYKGAFNGRFNFGREAPSDPLGSQRELILKNAPNPRVVRTNF